MVVITWLVVGMEVGRDGCACIVPPCGGSMNRPFATVISPPLFFYVAICDTSAYLNKQTNRTYNGDCSRLHTFGYPNPIHFLRRVIQQSNAPIHHRRPPR